MSKRITITIHDDIDESLALRRAAELIERVPNRDAELYWYGGEAACFSDGTKQTAIHVWKSNRYEFYKKMQDEK